MFVGVVIIVRAAVKPAVHEYAVNGLLSFPDSDGSVVLRPGNKYEYTFGFELPQQG